MPKKPVSEASSVQSTKFIKGQSGNPKGRPVTVEHFRKMLRDYARARLPELLDIAWAQALDNPTMTMELLRLSLEK